MSGNKKRKYKCVFSADIGKNCPYAKPCMPNVADYKHKFHCKICRKNFTLASGGLNDVVKHGNTATHKLKSKEIDGKFNLRTRVFFIIRNQRLINSIPSCCRRNIFRGG